MDRSPASPTYLDWREDTAARWGREPIRLAHGWHEHALFSMDALAALIERYPESHYALVATSRAGEAERRWREGEFGALDGREVIEAIARGGLWLNLRNVHEVDARYAALLAAAHDELAARLPGFRPGALRMGILVSSPGAAVHYHADLPGQALWQIAGGKTVRLYPPRPPFLPPEALERVAFSGVEVGMPYAPAFDAHAAVFDLIPGQMLHWPLNAPHRVDNHDVLNVSVTTEYWTPEIRRAQMVTLAHGVLRHYTGVAPAGRATSGAGFWAKAALQAAWRRSPLARRQRRRPIDFRLCREAPQGRVDIPPRYRDA